jgi:leader peptidase (prepilin peptidase)/N-methyltransferase
MTGIPPEAPVLGVLVLLGASLGSFLNVVIYRVPRGQSLLRPRSRCPRCGATLRFWENLPVLGWLLVLGRCRRCREPVSWRYPLVELLSIGLALACRHAFGYTMTGLLYYLFLLALAAVAFIDAEHMIIPDSISIPFALAGVAASALWLPITPLESLLGFVTGGGTLFLIGLLYRKVRGAEGMGGGDVKLMAMVGAFLGPQAALLTIFLGSFLGAFVGGILLSRGRGGQAAVAFGSFLAPSAVVVLFWGQALWQGYRGVLG